MKTFELKGEPRENFGKSAAKSYRSDGLIPCVVYGGNDQANINFVVKQSDLRKLIYTPDVYLINLNLGDNISQAILKEVQFHPVKEQILHIDFLHVFEDLPVEIEIPVRLEGLAVGVKAGGKLTLDSRKLKVRGLAANLPEILTVNVEHLQLGKSIQVEELEFENLELLNSKDTVVCRVQVVRASKLADSEIEGEEETDEDAAAEEGGEETAEE